MEGGGRGERGNQSKKEKWKGEDRAKTISQLFAAFTDDVLLVLATNDVASRGYVFCLKKRRVINYFDNPAFRVRPWFYCCEDADALSLSLSFILDFPYLSPPLLPPFQGFGDGHALASSPDGRSLIVGSLTAQCPDVTHPQCRLEESTLNQNLWRFFLFGAEDLPKVDFSEEELKEAAEKRASEAEAAEEAALLEKEERQREREAAERWLEEWQERRRP